MCYSISIVIDLKKSSNITNTQELITDIALNSSTSNFYEDYQLDGINNYIRTNNKIIIYEFDNIINLENFIEIIITIKNKTIEYVFHDNNIIYASKKYLNDLNKNLHSKKNLLDKIKENKLNPKYKNIYMYL